MNAIPRYELLKDAYAIIDGITDEAVALGPPCSSIGESLTKGTVCDPAGWLALHPDFRQLGLSITSDGAHILYNGLGGHDRSSGAVMAMVFGIDVHEAEQLFAPRDDGSSVDALLTDKQLWLKRVRDYLQSCGQLHTLQDVEPADFSELPETAIGSEHKLRMEGPNSQQPLQAGR